MAKTKAEMQSDHEAYESLMVRANVWEGQGLYRAAVEAALAAWPHVDGMMQYGKKYGGKEFASVLAIEMVLKYAPLMLDYRSLDTLEQLLKEYKRIERDTADDMGKKLADARARMWANHQLWGHLMTNPGARQDELRRILGGEQDYWRWVAESWEKMGLLGRTGEGLSYRLALLTRMGQVVSGKCPACGDVEEAPKAMLLETMNCPGCGVAVMFVILSKSDNDELRE
jgi:hypothetical protein